MFIYKALRILLLVPVVSVLSQAQATMIGSPLSGDVIRPRLESEVQATNALLGDLVVSAIADDNNNNSTVHPIGGSQYYFAPGIALQRTRPRLTWNIGYSPGLRLYVPGSLTPDQLTHVLGGVLRWDISKRLALGLRQDYLRTNDPFQQFGEAPLQSDIGVLNRPPEFPISNFRYSELFSEVESDYQLEKHTLVGVNGSFMQISPDQHQLRSQGSFITTRTTSGSAFVSHQFTARQSLGVQYQLLNMLFQGNSHTITQGLFLFDRLVISQHTTFTMFAGPQYSRIHNQVAITSQSIVVPVPESETLWSPAGGAMLSWGRDRTAFYVDLTRRVNAGLGLLSSVEMTEASLDIQRKVTDRWIVNVSGQINDETLLSTASTDHILLSHIDAGVSREFSRDTHLRLAYQRIRQSGNYLYPFGLGNHNRFLVTFERRFAWPVGR